MGVTRVLAVRLQLLGPAQPGGDAAPWPRLAHVESRLDLGGRQSWPVSTAIAAVPTPQSSALWGHRHRRVPAGAPRLLPPGPSCIGPGPRLYYVSCAGCSR